MNKKFYHQKGFYLTLLTSILIISVSLITQYKKALFVHETGNIKIFGSLGTLLAIGLLLKWKFAREILGVFSLIAFVAIVIIMINTNKEFLISYGILLITLTLIILLLIFSNSVKSFLNNR